MSLFFSCRINNCLQEDMQIDTEARISTFLLCLKDSDDTKRESQDLQLQYETAVARGALFCSKSFTFDCLQHALRMIERLKIARQEALKQSEEENERYVVSNSGPFEPDELNEETVDIWRQLANWTGYLHQETIAVIHASSMGDATDATGNAIPAEVARLDDIDPAILAMSEDEDDGPVVELESDLAAILDAFTLVGPGPLTATDAFLFCTELTRRKIQRIEEQNAFHRILRGYEPCASWKEMVRENATLLDHYMFELAYILPQKQTLPDDVIAGLAGVQNDTNPIPIDVDGDNTKWFVAQEKA
ncbi:hypothetical protein CVT24_009854 [Panaeolus cyanescens]|uniref:Uncharacterized protein n=1 Tax=Panaeolus cyanescens TaxID=181874 RepID=A0A409X5B5_9AGAR|nr:hypothetical protein CVT24_009854 [Panaeolus cyanescens]